jgi:hypothetical protein
VPYAEGDRKICSACRNDLPLNAFNKNRAFKDGLANQCRDCLNESRRKWREAHPDRHKARHVKNRYGIALDEYEAMAQRANGKCPICKEPPPPPFKAFDLDHDHETGKVRGLLCRPCNLALGGARDNPTILRALADYIEYHRANPSEDRPPPVLPTFYIKGEAHHKAKLTEAQAREVKALVQAGVSQTAVATRFGVRQTTVSMIVRRRLWKHLPGPTVEEAAEARRRWDEQHAKEES